LRTLQDQLVLLDYQVQLVVQVLKGLQARVAILALEESLVILDW